MPPVPVTLLTGALGAGKTTLLNQVLAEDHGLRIAVIENELGEVDIDSELLDTSRAEILELAGGCVCCSVQGRLLELLERLAPRAGELDAVVLETTGVADPVPVVSAFLAHTVRLSFRVRRLVTVVDAVYGLHDLASPSVWQRQVKLADAIAVSKVELSTAVELEGLKRRLRELNPGASMHRADHGQMPIATLLGVEPDRQSPTMPVEPDHHDHGHAEDGHGFTSVALGGEVELDPIRFERWMGTVSGAGVLRAKGVLAVPGAERRHVIHSVRGDFSMRLGRSWLGAARRSRLVLIGRDLDREALTAGFERCVAVPVPDG